MFMHCEMYVSALFAIRAGQKPKTRYILQRAPKISTSVAFDQIYQSFDIFTTDYKFYHSSAFIVKI